MELIRLFGNRANSLSLGELPALTRDEFRQRENESQFPAPDATYPADWQAAQDDARAAWRALGVAADAVA